MPLQHQTLLLGIHVDAQAIAKAQTILLGAAAGAVPAQIHLHRLAVVDHRRLLVVQGADRPREPGAAQALYFFRRAHLQAVIRAQAQLARQGEHARPAVLLLRQRRFPHIQPANHDPPAIGSGEALRGIEIVAVIHLPEFAMANKTLAWLPLADQIAALEQITVAEPRGLHPLWGKHQNAFAVEGEEVRALPHIAHGAFRFIQHPRVLPLAQIG